MAYVEFTDVNGEVTAVEGWNADGWFDSLIRYEGGDISEYEDWFTDGSHQDTHYKDDGAVAGTISHDANDNVTAVAPSSRPALTGGDIGLVLGSQLGRAIANGSVLAEIGASTVLGVLLKNVGDAIEGGLREAITGAPTGAGTLDIAAQQTFDQLGLQLSGQVAGALSSILTAELADAIGLSGFEGQVFSTAGGLVTSRFLQNIPQTVGLSGEAFSKALFKGLNPTDIAAGAAGAFGSLAGSALASKVITPENPEAALFGQAGSALGTLGGIGAASWLATAAGFGLSSLGGILMPGVGAFFGAYLGQVAATWAGNQWFEQDPTARALLGLKSDGTFGLIIGVTEDGGGVEIPRALAKSVSDTVYSVLSATGARLDTNEALARVEVGYYTNSYNQSVAYADPYGGVQRDEIYRLSSGAENDKALGLVANHATEAVFKNLHVLGGDPLMKRAYYAARDKGLDELGFALQIARDYNAYLDNTTLINALIAADSHSELAAGWLVTLLRVQELGLNQHSPNDFRGGVAANLRDRGLSGEFLEWTPDLHPDDGTMLLLRKLNHTVDIRDAFGPGRVDRETGTEGPDTLDFGGRASTAMVHADGGAGDDSLYGHDTTDILVGAAGNDGLDGRAGHDWLHGGDGTDNLRGGDGDDLLVGGAGNDTLNGDRGTDTLVGGEGDDVIVIDMSERDVIQAASAGSRAQTDSVRIANADGLASDFTRRGADLDIALRKGGAAVGTLTVADFFLTRYALDTIVFSDDGGSFEGQEVWRNEVGDVRVNETVSEANGERRQLTLDGQLNKSWTSIDTRFAVNNGQNVLKSETVYRDDGGDEVRYGDAPNSIYADAPGQSWDALGGDDRIYGTNGTDTLIGGTGNDGLSGEGGDDEIEGGAGADEMNGGDGRDWVDYSRSPGGGVQAYLASGTGDRFDATGDRYNAIENIRGSAGGDDLRGDDRANRLRGQDGNDGTEEVVTCILDVMSEQRYIAFSRHDVTSLSFDAAKTWQISNAATVSCISIGSRPCSPRRGPSRLGPWTGRRMAGTARGGRMNPLRTRIPVRIRLV